jgi:hypothetical protein
MESIEDMSFSKEELENQIGLLQGMLEAKEQRLKVLTVFLTSVNLKTLNAMIADSGGLRKQIFALTCTIEEQKKEIAILKKQQEHTVDTRVDKPESLPVDPEKSIFDISAVDLVEEGSFEKYTQRTSDALIDFAQEEIIVRSCNCVLLILEAKSYRRFGWQ